MSLWGDAAIRAFPGAFDERQRPRCGHWSQFGGPCVCGDPANHDLGGRFGPIYGPERPRWTPRGET